MILNNFRKILFGGIFGSTAQASNIPTFGLIELVTVNGSTATISNNAYNSSSSFGQTVCSILNAFNQIANSESVGSSTIKVGTGTTAPTADDYNLEDEATGVTCDSVSVGLSGNLTKIYTGTFANSTSSDVNITELGLFLKNNYYSFMLDRTILSTPITIPAGQSKSITYEIAF